MFSRKGSAQNHDRSSKPRRGDDLSHRAEGPFAVVRPGSREHRVSGLATRGNGGRCPECGTPGRPDCCPRVRPKVARSRKTAQALLRVEETALTRHPAPPPLPTPANQIRPGHGKRFFEPSSWGQRSGRDRAAESTQQRPKYQPARRHAESSTRPNRHTLHPYAPATSHR
jgi:hypothetical protein